MSFSRCLIVGFGLSSLLFMCGCASVSIRPGLQMQSAAAKPREIVVANFAFADGAKVRVDRSDAQMAGFKTRLTGYFRASLVKCLERFGIPVTFTDRASLQAPGLPRQSAWLVTGRFLRINQGSRALRILLGLGAGGTKLETEVSIFDLSTRPARLIAKFETTGGSNAEPGALISGGPDIVSAGVGIGIGIASSAQHGVTEDARRTARMIAFYTSQQLASRGYIPASAAKNPKLLGAR